MRTMSQYCDLWLRVPIHRCNADIFFFFQINTYYGTQACGLLYFRAMSTLYTHQVSIYHLPSDKVAFPKGYRYVSQYSMPLN